MKKKEKVQRFSQKGKKVKNHRGTQILIHFVVWSFWITVNHGSARKSTKDKTGMLMMADATRRVPT